MGWTFWYHYDQQASTRDIVMQHEGYDLDTGIRRDGKLQVVGHATGSEFLFLAVKELTDDGYYGPKGFVWAEVILYKRRTNEFGVKEMCEFMGPGGEPSDRFLNLLTPLDQLPADWQDRQSVQWARRWREDARAYNAAQRDRTRLARQVKAGTRIRVARPLTFSDGIERDTFTYEGTKSVFRASDGARVRLSGWKNREFEVLPAAA